MHCWNIIVKPIFSPLCKYHHASLSDTPKPKKWNDTYKLVSYEPFFFYLAACDKVSKRARGDITPTLNVKAIEAAVNSASYEEGLQKYVTVSLLFQFQVYI